MGSVGCGGHDRSTEISSDDIVRDIERDQRDEQRLEGLERQVDRLKRANEREGARHSPPAEDQPRAGTIVDGLGGEVGVAIGRPGGQPEVSGTLTTGSAWSTIKVPIALALLRDAGGPDGLDSGQADAMRRALTASDNAAAAQLFEALAARHGGIQGAATAVTEILRAGGDGSTVVSTQGRDGFSPYGQTEWSLEAQERFMSGLVGGCVVDGASTTYVLDLMGQVTSDTWGLGSIGLPARWKGGWGPGTDGRYLVRQMGVVEQHGEKVVLVIAARADDGQFGSAQSLASQVAQRAMASTTDLGPQAGGC